MRKFYFVVFDESDKISNKYHLDCVTDLGGLGYSLDISKISGDVEDYVTKVVQKKKKLSLTIQHFSKYIGYNALCNWLERHIGDSLALAYDDGTTLLYISGLVSDTSKTEINEWGILEQKIEFSPTSPFFEKIDNDIRITSSSTGKFYSYTYPYCYGLNSIENNEIENTYIKEIPINVEIKGSIVNPVIKLLDENNVEYNEIRFVNVSLANNQRLIINSAQKKIWYDNGTGNLVDYYDHLDGAYDSFLRAKPLMTSKVSINLVVRDTGSLIGSRRQYRLR